MYHIITYFGSHWTGIDLLLTYSIGLKKVLNLKKAPSLSEYWENFDDKLRIFLSGLNQQATG